MIRRAGPDDVLAMELYLEQHAETSMFLRGNLAAHGTEDTVHPHGTTFFLAEEEGAICGIAGVTNGGYLMCQTHGASEPFFEGVAERLEGRSLQGMTSEPLQVRGLFRAIGCDDATFSLREVEPLYAVDVARLRKQHGPGHSLRRPVPEDADWLVGWFKGYHADTGLRAPVEDDAVRIFCEKEDARILMNADVPVAMAAFNARAKETVQIGGVYVPSEKRGRGYGGEVVVRQLQEAAEFGVEKAILFAATPFAARAYESVGFQRIGSYEIALFSNPWQVRL